jgi:predicted amidohydrolase YtcJ
MPATTVLIRGDLSWLAGKFLIPGLIDLHAHLSKTRGSALGLFVTNGVTTVRDMGGAANIARMRKDPPSGRKTSRDL